MPVELPLGYIDTRLLTDARLLTVAKVDWMDDGEAKVVKAVGAFTVVKSVTVTKTTEPDIFASFGLRMVARLWLLLGRF